MHFTYRAQKTDGSFYEGNRDAADKFALARELQSEGETIITATEKEGGHKLQINVGRFLPFLQRVSMHDKVIFTRNLAGMLGAGLTVSRALAVLLRQTKSEKLQEVITGLSGRITAGESLSHAFSAYPKVFSPIVVSMVQAGEEGGSLAHSLLSISEQMNRSYTLLRKVRGALLYPGVVITVMAAVGLVMFIYIVPQLTSAFKDFNVQLPLSTRIVVAVSDFLQAHIVVGLGGFVGLIVLCVVLGRSPQGKRLIDLLLLHIPFITPMVKETNAARTAQTLSSLLSSGVEVVTALDITGGVLSNSQYKNVLFLAREAIQRGEPMSGIFRANEHIYPPFLSEMVAVGEETGKLGEMLEETGTFFEAEVEQKTKNISTIIEPVLMVVVGVVVGFFAVAMISPAYTLMNSI